MVSTERNTTNHCFKTDKVLVEERLDNTIKIKYKDHYLNFIELPEKPLKIRSSPIILTEHQSNWIPPKDHPWRSPLSGIPYAGQFQYV